MFSAAVIYSGRARQDPVLIGSRLERHDQATKRQASKDKKLHIDDSAIGLPARPRTTKQAVQG